MAERAQPIPVDVPHPADASRREASPAAAPIRLRVVEPGHPGPGSHHPSAREVAFLVLLSIVLHGGAAYGFYGRDAESEPQRKSKVQIEFARPPAEPRVTAPPPPPPPAAPEKTKPLARPEAASPVPSAAPEPAASAAAPVAAVDTGSSAEAADDGNLVAGKGGLGVGPVAPLVQAPAAPAAPAPIVQAHEGANYSKNPRPAYPGRAKREGWEGKVLVRVQIQPNGRPGAMKVQQSSGRAVLDEAALDAIKSWSFVPAKQGGEAVVGWVTVPIVFRLQ